jgi:triphosphatase
MEAGPGADAEVEWQLDAQDLRPVLRWIETISAAGTTEGVTIAPAHTDNHVDTYLDTADRRLDRAGYSVRLRRGRRPPAEATLKSLNGGGPTGPRIRRELAEHVELDEPSAIAGAPGPVGERVRALVGSRELVPLFDVQTRRRVFPLAVAGIPSGDLLLDDTAIRESDSGRILGRLHRVEVEVPPSAVASVEALVDKMRASFGLQSALLTKYEAALAATGRRRTEPDDFGPTTVEPGDTIGHLGLAVLRRQLTALLAKEAGTRLGDDVEELHDMRVASRRLRAAMALFGDVLPAETERLRPELAWVGQTIGVVRDLDVQLQQLDGWTNVLAPSDQEALRRLRSLLEGQRARARSEMLQALESPRYGRLVRRLGTMLRTRSGARTAPARAVAPDLVESRHRALRKAKRQIGPDSDAAVLHRLRIAAKRYRYALEFLSDVYPGETKRLIRRTIALQDVLGAHQDAHVAITRLRDLAGNRGAELGPETVFAMGEIAGRYAASMDDVRLNVPEIYARLGGKEWKRFRRRLEAQRPPLASAHRDHPDRVMLSQSRSSILGKTSRERTIDGNGDRSA